MAYGPTLATAARGPCRDRDRFLERQFELSRAFAPWRNLKQIELVTRRPFTRFQLGSLAVATGCTVVGVHFESLVPAGRMPHPHVYYIGYRRGAQRKLVPEEYYKMWSFVKCTNEPDLFCPMGGYVFFESD